MSVDQVCVQKTIKTECLKKIVTDMKTLICSKQGIKINYVNIMSDDGVCGGGRGSR